MNIFEEIEKIAQQGYSIEYQTVDQIQNGYKRDVDNGSMPRITYTVYIMCLDNPDPIYSESCDHIEDCLKAGIRYFKNNLVKS